MLNSIPCISAKKPKAAFYISPKIDTEKYMITDDNQVTLDFLREKRVLVVPGRGFNCDKLDHFRIMYLP